MRVVNIIILIIILFTGKIFSQSEYSKYIIADSLKKTAYTKSKHGDSKINYLGAIKKTNGDTLYYVFSVFSRAQAGIVMHGHSEIIYLNKKHKEVKRYDMGMPENLPYKLHNSTLYFKYLDEKTNKKLIFKNKVGLTPPTIMCCSPNWCD